MPPATYWTFNREWNDLTDAPALGTITATTTYSSADAEKGAVSTRVSSRDAPTARFAYNHCIFRSAVAVSPTYMPRPWVTAGPLKTGAETAFAASHYVGAGVSGDSGNLAVEWTLEHPTFAANVQAEPDRRGLPMSGTASVAACACADVGLRFKYDPLRSGLLDYALGARYALPGAGSRFLVAILDAKNRVSATFAGATEIAAGQHTMPLRYALNAGDNAASLGAAVGVTSPCGRDVKAVVSVRPEVDLKLSVTSPLSDAWKVAVSAAPLKYGTGKGFLGLQLIGQ
eukprot:CAMPEP_0174842164 /NCGR_PEP_ID=MMETSP1114-20130205/9738_1 /TAXON_ID=312471 /ORGANISM="Neobodo designis, Strain CCAP 1951/1" /LENGTH=285 /DNA_ID=CAMNT_0016076361 /DNA_START=36 /DNA_END=893 /DNA_ORIENTATION=-